MTKPVASGKYRRPDFDTPDLAAAPDATFVAIEADGVLPKDFFSTTNLPTYVRIAGQWRRPRRPRMDCALVLEGDDLFVAEPRDLKAGTYVAIGYAEDGSQGVLVHHDPFNEVGGDPGEFRFMATNVSRERPVNYERLARSIHDERERGGYIAWVVGPALVHSRARDDFVWMVDHGYVSVVLAGNAVAVHDLEAAIFGTTLGMTSEGESADHGHSLHMRAINEVWRAGSIDDAVAQGIIDNGIMHSLVRNGIPYVLGGSIRDDGPLPGVYTDMLEAQRATREHAVKATYAIFVATALHSIAVGNMLPAFVEGEGDDIRPLQTLCVDQTEFVVNKLRDRGTRQAQGVVTNAQDFMHILRLHLERCSQSPG